MKCMFCNKDIAKKQRDIIGGVVGNKTICEDCALELADVIYHAAKGKFTKKTICDKLDKVLTGGEK